LLFFFEPFPPFAVDEPMDKKKLTLAALLFGLVAAPVALLAYLYRRPLPKVRGTLKLGSAGLSPLHAAVEIVRDRWGVPHIYAQDLDDLFLAQGFVHAQERLWQMELNRRLAHGRLSEIFGTIAFDTDRLIRIIGLSRSARRDLAHADPEALRVLQAYALGINTWLGANQNRLPLEFTLLGFKPAPWDPLDSLAIAKFIAWGLSGNWDSEIMHAALIDKLGAERAARLQGEYHPDNPLVFQDHTYVDMLDLLVKQFDAAREWLPVRGLSGMSNNWVIAGSRSATGKPLLANDPHLTLQMPSVWFENHLNAPDLEATGVSFPGTPAVVIGHNRDLAWGLTASFADVQDLYIEKFNPNDAALYEFQGNWEHATVVREEIRVKGEPRARVEEVAITRHGPVINSIVPTHVVGLLHQSAPAQSSPDETSLRLALRWAAYEESHLLRGVLRLNLARDWDQFAEALRDWDAPSMNFVYADRAGNIGYYMPGRIPIRAKGSGLAPVPGWTGEYEWKGWIPHEELPHLFNPPQGYIASANNLVVGKEYPYFLTGETQNGYRARRIVDLLTGKEKLSAEDFAGIQVDEFCRPAQEFCALLTEHEPAILEEPALTDAKSQAAVAIELLKNWDFHLTADSAGGGIYKLTQYFAMHRVFGPLLGPLTDHYLGNGFAPVVADHTIYYLDYAPLVLQRILAENEAEWLRDATRDEVLAGALHDAIVYFREAIGEDVRQWQWGKVHPVGFNHPLGASRPLDRIFNRGPYPFGGDSNTVWQAGYNPKLPFKVEGSFSASWRQIVDLDDWDSSRAIHTTGQSGHPASRHYDDMVRMWLNGRYHPMLWSREKVESHVEARLRLE
jgi:penicillin G amidase